MICWKIRIFAYWTTPSNIRSNRTERLWFAEKFVSLLIEQHQKTNAAVAKAGCDLLKNSYLCLLNNTGSLGVLYNVVVVICWKIRIFAYWTTPPPKSWHFCRRLWFAEKFVSLLIEQHLSADFYLNNGGCDLLKNSYLCLLNNTAQCWMLASKALWFAEKFVSLLIEQHRITSRINTESVVICWKIRIFAYWTTPDYVEVAQYESVVSNDRNGKSPMLEGRNLDKQEVSSFLLICLHALSPTQNEQGWR